MASLETDRDSSLLGTRMPRAVANLGGVGFIVLGAWAMAAGAFRLRHTRSSAAANR